MTQHYVKWRQYLRYEPTHWRCCCGGAVVDKPSAAILEAEYQAEQRRAILRPKRNGHRPQRVGRSVVRMHRRAMDDSPRDWRE